MAEDPSFGQWLRHRRRSLDLTQAELAGPVGCTPNHLRAIEADRRRPSREIAARLATCLAIDPADGPAFVRFARGESSRPPPPARESSQDHAAADRVPLWYDCAAAHGNVPFPVTSLVGRTDELALVRALLARPDVRLVTLTGTGGIGKTRLAVQVAHELQQHAAADSIRLVELAPIRDPQLVVVTIARVLGVPESGQVPLLERLIDVIRDRQVLLVLDNCEHVVAAGGVLATLLAACPALKMLATSRVHLQVYGEWEVPVEALALPPAQAALTRETALAAEAVQLFVARAQAAQPRYTLTPEEVPDVVAVCRHLGGIPLAIELAAARIRDWPPRTMVTQLASSLEWLTGGPQNLPDRLQSMRAAIGWSYALLDPPLQELFRQLGVFVGGWTLAAAAAVCLGDARGDGHLRDGVLRRLCAHGLVQRSELSDVDTVDAIHYWMHEPIREYAHELLVQHGEAHATHRRHAAFYAALATLAEPHLRRREQLAWLALLTHAQPNLRAALGWTLDDRGDVVLGAQLCQALGWFWWLRGQYHEGTRWLAQARALDAAATPHSAVDHLNWMSMLNFGTGDPDGAKWASREAHDLAEAAKYLRGLAWARMFRGFYDGFAPGDAALYITLLEDAARLAHVVGDDWLRVYIYWNLADFDPLVGQRIMPDDEAARLAEDVGDRWNLVGMGLVWSTQCVLAGDWAEARTILDRAAVQADELEDQRMQGLVLWHRGRMLAEQGAVDEAITQLEAAERLFRTLGDRSFQAVCRHEIGQLYLRQGDLARARSAFLESLTVFRATANPLGSWLTLMGLAAVQADAEQAARLLAPLVPEQANGSRRYDQFVMRHYTRILAQVQARLDDTRFRRAWQEGQRLTIEQALAVALEGEDIANA